MKTYLLFFFLLNATISHNTVWAQPISKPDSLALVDLYNNSNGANWANSTNWLHGPVSTWYGITTADTFVTYVDLRSNRLNGQLPPSIGNLKHLLSLRLEFNTLDTIPASIGNLESVLWIELGQCKLKGSIPSSIGNLLNITNLFLADNQLTGSIPSSIGNLKTLEELYLHNNQLTGSIPASMGDLTNLIVLYLNSNELSGSIPSSFRKLSSLMHVYLYDNQLSGGLSSLIGNLPSLMFVYIGKNQFSGTIPASIGKLINIQYLDLSSNQLSGGIPVNIRRMKNLKFLNLKSNHLSGDVSPLANLKRRTGFDISYNNFTFEGMETMVQAHPSVSYSPQAPIHVQQAGDSLYVSSGGTINNNKYQWFYSGNTIPQIIRGDSVFHPKKSGAYYAYVTNKIAKQLVLTTDTINYSKEVNSQFVEGNRVVKNNSIILTAYPNPVTDVLYLHTSEKCSVSLANEMGKILFTKYIVDYEEINMSKFAQGVYFIINNSTGTVEKIVKTRQ